MDTDAPSHPTIDATKRYASVILGLLACGFLMPLASGSMTSARGVAGPTLGVALDPIGAVLAIALCLVPCFLIAVLVGRMVNAAVAAFVLGGGLAALSMNSGTHLDLLFAGESTWPSVVIETFGWAVIVLVLAAGLMRLTGPLPDQPWNKAEDALNPAVLFHASALRGAAAGALALIVVWAVAANDLKDQALAATTLAGAATGLAGRMLAPRVQPVLLFAAPVVFIAVGQLGVGLLGDGGVESWMTGRQSGLAIPTPLDAAAGALMGVAIGLGWTRGHFAEQTH